MAMTRDHWVQFAAATLAVVCLFAAATLTSSIDAQRRELRLSFDAEVGRRVPPQYVLATAALGSLRGLAADVLWYRAERLKQEGKFYEANTLAQWITTLQPRFPQVWSFHAWNMAYNISVATHTPQERWDWVNKGVRLLRDEGIVYNPDSVPLYRELGWIFFHKIGQMSDDMHWYYKVQLALEWQELLGAQGEGASTEQVLAEFAPIAHAAERYFRLDRPTREIRKRLQQMAENQPADAEALNKWVDLDIVTLEKRLGRLISARQGSDPSLASELAAVQQMVREQQARAGSDPLTLLYQDAAETQAMVEQFRAAGVELNAAGLRRVGRLLMYSRYTNVRALMAQVPQWFDELDHKTLDLLAQSSDRAGADRLLAFWRAKVLLQEYHMDPLIMAEIMELLGPMDWRHPASHGAFWSYIGVQRSGLLSANTGIDILNTDRQVLYSMQQLMFFGRISFDPIAERIDTLPDPRFIPAYDRAMDLALTRARELELVSAGTLDSFKTGHENFLLKAIQFAYLYGDVEQAQGYYDKVRRLYGQEPMNLSSGRYLLALPDLVITEMEPDLDSMQVARAFIESQLAQAFEQGLRNGRLDVFQRLMGLAERVYDEYQRRQASPDPTAPQARLGLPSTFDQVLANSYVAYMSSPSLPLIERARVYRNTPFGLIGQTYHRFHEALRQQGETAGVNIAVAFPPPAGFEQQQPPIAAPPVLPQTIERN
jgi:hypothetical protein